MVIVQVKRSSVLGHMKCLRCNWISWSYPLCVSIEGLWITFYLYWSSIIGSYFFYADICGYQCVHIPMFPLIIWGIMVGPKRVGERGVQIEGILNGTKKMTFFLFLAIYSSKLKKHIWGGNSFFLCENSSYVWLDRSFQKKDTKS